MVKLVTIPKGHSSSTSMNTSLDMPLGFDVKGKYLLSDEVSFTLASNISDPHLPTVQKTVRSLYMVPHGAERA